MSSLGPLSVVYISFIIIWLIYNAKIFPNQRLGSHLTESSSSSIANRGCFGCRHFLSFTLLVTYSLGLSNVHSLNLWCSIGTTFFHSNFSRCSPLSSSWKWSQVLQSVPVSPSAPSTVHYVLQNLQGTCTCSPPQSSG